MIERILFGTAIAAAGCAGYTATRRGWMTWGVDPAETLATNPEPRPAGAEESSEVFQPA